uniref:Taste receptor type 2 n=1 Tax=Leptobrachium leishanense TaxID=445787 RepID=A0A8C5QBZ0_9ANUR
MVTLGHPRWCFNLVFVACSIGILLNSCILAMNVRDWKRGTRLSLCDKILVLIAWNNVHLQCVMHGSLFILLFFPALYQNSVIFSMCAGVIIHQILCNVKFTSCLCIYYCLSIVTLKHPLIVCMKQRIVVVMSGLLLVAGVGSFVISILIIWNAHTEPINPTGNRTSTLLLGNLSIQVNPTYIFLIISGGCCLPFLMAFLSVSLILISLGTHAWNMKQNPSGFRVPSVDTHLRAARIMIQLILLFAIYCSSQVILFSSSWTIRSFLDIGAFFLTLTYPGTHAWILIMGNSKLWSGFLEVYHYTLQSTGCKKPLAQ